MRKIICILILIIPIICSSQNKKLNLRIWAFTNYDAWTHMDPVYLDEPNGDVDNFRPVEYEERKTELRLGLDQLIMEYGPGMFGAARSMVFIEDSCRGICEQSLRSTPFRDRSVGWLVGWCVHRVAQLTFRFKQNVPPPVP